VLSVINMSGLGDPRWDEELPAPTPLSDVLIEMGLIKLIRQVWWASPDQANMGMVALPWNIDNRTVSITLPKLHYWAMIALELESTE
jgi:hypothetical protein